MDLLEALQDGKPVHLKGLNLPAWALPETDLPEGYRIQPLSDDVQAFLRDRLNPAADISEGLGQYMFAWRILDVLDLDTVRDRLSRRSGVEDAIVALGLLNLESSVAVTVVGEAWIGETMIAQEDFNLLSIGVDDEGGVYPDQATNYVQPAEMHLHFTKSMTELARARERVVSDPKASSRLDIGLRQWTLANDEFSAHLNDDWLVDPLLRLMVTVEALLGERQAQLTRSLRQRGAVLSGPAPDEVLRADQAIARCYALRSQYVHGGSKRPQRNDLEAARTTVATILRNWIVTVAAWIEEGESFNDFLTVLDEGLLHPPTLDRVVGQPLLAHSQRVGSPIDD